MVKKVTVDSIQRALAVHSIIIATIAIIRRELQHHCHHNTTRVSIKTERKEGERIKVTK